MDLLVEICRNFWKILCFILAIYIIRTRRTRKRRPGVRVESGEYVLNIIINTDYKMSSGKIVSQIGHAMSKVMDYLFKNGGLFEAWKRNGEAKVVLKASGSEISQIVRLANNNGVKCIRIHDAGRTQVPPGANTVVVLGPALKSTLSLISGDLKLY